MNSGLTAGDVEALAIDPIAGSTLYAGTFGGGVFDFQFGADSPSTDLTGSWLKLSRSCKQENVKSQCELYGKFVLQNQGTEQAPTSFVTRFYLSSDGVYDRSDSYLTTVTTGKLRAGCGKRKRWTARLSTGESASGKFVIAVVDATNAVEEMSEGNNRIIFGPIP
jgi:hypothetical protein